MNWFEEVRMFWKVLYSFNHGGGFDVHCLSGMCRVVRSTTSILLKDE